MDYQIESTNVYYLTFGNFISGSLIDAEKIGFFCVIAYGILNDGRKKNREVALACAAVRMAEAIPLHIPPPSSWRRIDFYVSFNFN